MKHLIIALVASSFLATPMAFAGDARVQTGTIEIAQMRDHQTERRVEKRIEKKVVKRTVIKKHRFAKGHRMTREERRHTAAINDYRRYKLRAPPRGQQWVRVDNQFLLISVATGVIAGLVSAN